jgi:hypothetical protein
MEAPESVPLKTTPPGKQLDVSVDMTAPDKKGSYRADFQLTGPNDVAIPINNGKYVWVIVNVDTP